MTRTKSAFLALVAVLLSPMAANADEILCADSITATNSIAGSFGDPNNLINQGGLATGFTCGVTDFDSYMSGDPQHTVFSAGAEWFTDFEVTSAILTFDLGSVALIDGLAAWVDEYWGAGLISVAASIDNIVYSALGSFAPTDWPVYDGTNPTYGADVFRFASTSARYVQLALSDCPQPNSEAGGGCGMGEVAFRGASAVPEPGTLALLGIGLLGMGLARRRRKV